MSDDKDDLDASDWLSSQFNPTGQVPEQTPPDADEPPADAAPAAPAPDARRADIRRADSRRADGRPADVQAADARPADIQAADARPADVPPPLVSPAPAATAFPTALFPSASSPSPVYPTSAPPAAPAVPAVPAVPDPAPAPQPQSSAPEPNAAGGFNWGLRPSSASAPSEPSAPLAPPSVVPPVVPPVELPAVTPPPAVPPVELPPVEPAPDPTTPAPEPTTPMPSDAGEPTRPLSWDEFAGTQAAPAAAASAYVDEPTQAYTVQPTEAYTVQPAQAFEAPPWQQTGAPPDSPFGYGTDQEPTSAIDSLFGDHQFQAYEEVGVLKAVQAVPLGGGGDGPVDRGPRAPLSTTQKTLMGVAGGLIVVLIVIAMYFLGVHLGAASAATPKGTSTASSTDTPTPAGSGGPASPGVQQWSALQGGECLQPFSSAWATTFTVVSCSTDHDAQMVFKGKLPDSADTAYPSTSQFQTELTALCSAPTAINYAAASAVTDLQVSFSYPPSQSKWIAGDRTYYCFVDRQSGGNLPADLSVKASTTTQ